MTDLRFYVSWARCSDLTSAQVRKIIKTSFQKFLVYRIKRELNPLAIIGRLSRIRSLGDIRLYWRILNQFVQIQKA